MGNNSVFDDLGIGSSDLGLSEDPDDVKRDNQRKLDAEQSAIDAEEKKSTDMAAASADKRRVASGSKATTLLTGPQGLEDDETSVSKKTLLGS